MINFKNFNINDFCNDLDLCDWVSIEQFKDVDETCRRFKDVFTQVCDKHCPVITRRVRKSSDQTFLRTGVHSSTFSFTGQFVLLLIRSQSMLIRSQVVVHLYNVTLLYVRMKGATVVA